DDEEYRIAITPILPTEEPDNSLSMGDEHLDTILTTKSNEVIKSSVEDLVPTPSESEGIPDNMCDVTFRDNSLPLDISKDQFENLCDSNDDSTSIDDNYFSIDDIDYVEASPPHSKLVSLEEETDTSDNSLPESEIFCFDIKEKNSGSTTIHANISLLDLECFFFKSDPNPGDLTSIIDLEIRENISSMKNVNLPFEDDQSPLFAYVVWIFLP
nr:hypothetical protein [Tanacetum cinerariifolium]